MERSVVENGPVAAQSEAAGPEGGAALRLHDGNGAGLPVSTWRRLKRGVLGAPRNVHDPSLRHKLSLIAFLAWVGLGADGLSSSAYGPDAAYRTLGGRGYLGVALAAATALTVFIISYAYSRIIEHFPLGGGGYVVASALLGRSAGVVSGCALLIDYVLTVATSIAGCGDAVFSLLPLAYHHYKFPVELLAILVLTTMNIRGVKESVTLLVPIFLLFLVTHAVLILGGIVLNLPHIPQVTVAAADNFATDLRQVGLWGLFLLLMRAYSLGAGTYTGIEAVSNGLGIMRDPKVETGKRTMTYMAVSLAATAGGLILCFMLAAVHPVEGQTLNAVLGYKLAGSVVFEGLPVGNGFVAITMFAEATLLVVAAQAGFIDGPRVMANMAGDSWLPRRLSALSDRLTTQNGIMVVGIAATATLLYSHGHIETLLVMYSLNVFLTFSLSQAAMVRFWIRSRVADPKWRKHIVIHCIGFVLCVSIFVIMLCEKFSQGAWITLVITLTCVILCVIIRKHYRIAAGRVSRLDKELVNVPLAPAAESSGPLIFDPRQPTAAVLVSDYNGMGLHILYSIFRLFPGVYKNVVFVSIGVINSDFFRNESSIPAYAQRTQQMLQKYVELARRLRIPSQLAYRVGADIVQEASELCLSLKRELPQITFFAGEIVFERPRWYQRILHNETAYAIQRRIRFGGIPMFILPVVVRE